MSLDKFAKVGYSLGSFIPRQYNNSLDGLLGYHPKGNTDSSKYRMESKLDPTETFLFFNLVPGTGWVGDEGKVLNDLQFIIDPINNDVLNWQKRRDQDIVLNNSELKSATITRFIMPNNSDKMIFQETLYWHNSDNDEDFKTMWFWQPGP